MSRIQRAQRSSALSKLSGKAQKARTACGNSLAQAFQWFVHAKGLHGRLEAQEGGEFIAWELGDSAQAVSTWLGNSWLNAHCTTAGGIEAAVSLALTALLGASGADIARHAINGDASVKTTWSTSHGCGMLARTPVILCACTISSFS
jgi:hypothetical protein